MQQQQQQQQQHDSLSHTMINQPEKQLRVQHILSHGCFAIGAFLATLIWISKPILDLVNTGQLGVISQLTALPDSDCITLSCLLLVFGSCASYFLLKLESKQKALTQEQSLLRSIIESEPECVKTVSCDGTLLSMNPAGLKLVQADSYQEIDGCSVFDLIVPECQEKYHAFHQRILDGHNEQIQFDIIGLKGTRKTMESHAVPLHNENGEVTAQLSITRDISESKRLNERLQFQATHDDLTGLINRQEFEQRLENSIHRASADLCTHAVLFMDLDQFKIINDTCGHLAGDQLLKETGVMLRRQLRDQDTVARMGGDEFVVLLEYCAADKAQVLANEVRQTIEDFDFFWQGRVFKITASIGIVMVDYTTSDLNEVLSHSDSACYAAKDQGRNRIHMHQSDDKAIAKTHGEMQWVSKIHQGIKDQRFVLYAQIIEGLRDENIYEDYSLNEIPSITANAKPETHAEILIRYQDDAGKIIPPGAFLPAAERYGEMNKIDCYVIKNTFQYLSQNSQLLDEISTFCINLSGQSIADPDFLHFVVSKFESYPQLPRYICFEITETAAISNLSTAIHFITSVKQLGCRFSLDDFGSGLSSFSYLKNLPVDYVKIDGEFIKDIVDNSINNAMAASINDIAHLMGKKTVAEFVENTEIREQLISLGVDFAQGYGIHVPEPIENLLASCRPSLVVKKAG